MLTLLCPYLKNFFFGPLILLCAYRDVPLFFFALTLLHPYLFFYAIILLCTYPAVPLSRFSRRLPLTLLRLIFLRME